MPVLKGNVQSDGALVEVLLGWSAVAMQQSRAALRPVVSPIQVWALLDTGAELSCVDGSVIQHLGLTFTGVTPANLPAHGGLTFSALHDAGLTILHPSGRTKDFLIVLNLSVLELPLAPLGYQVLIGRDVLARCRFLYDGLNNSFRLQY